MQSNLQEGILKALREFLSNSLIEIFGSVVREEYQPYLD